MIAEEEEHEIKSSNYECEDSNSQTNAIQMLRYSVYNNKNM